MKWSSALSLESSDDKLEDRGLNGGLSRSTPDVSKPRIDREISSNQEEGAK